MATLTVTDGGGSGPGTLRAEINAAMDGDTIVFDPSVTAVDLSVGLVISKNVTIEGHQGGTGAPGVTINGGGMYTDFTINTGVNVSLDGLTIENGKGLGANGGFVNTAATTPTPAGAAGAGGILDFGTLTLTNSVVTGNAGTGGVGAYNTGSTGQGAGGGAGGGAAGGVYVAAGATLARNATDSFSSNMATGGSGKYGRFGNGPVNGSRGSGGAGAVSTSGGATTPAATGTSGNGAYSGSGGKAGQPGVAGYTYTANNKSYVGGGGGGGGGNAFADFGGLGAITTAAVCYASGTLIRVARGTVVEDVPVETLQVGDLVVTASGAQRPIRWLGHRITDCRRHPRPHDVMPIRIAAHAFSKHSPSRDLFLSPGHPVLVGAIKDGAGGYLVPIMCLINGTTIERVTVDEVTYWHVELEQHDILLAEGLPAESYIDLGSRPWFDGADGALYDPDLALPGQPGRCRPVAIDGPVVEMERRRLDTVFAMRLAGSCAWPSAEDALQHAADQPHSWPALR